MLCMLFYSGLCMYEFGRQRVNAEVDSQLGRVLLDNYAAECLRRLALPALVLVPLAFTSFHVQIITRIASGYVTHYLWLAAQIYDDSRSREQGKRTSTSQTVVRFMIMYAAIQGGMYSSFLPPA